MLFSSNHNPIGFDLPRSIVLYIVDWNVQLIHLIEVWYMSFSLSCCFWIEVILSLSHHFHIDVGLLPSRKYEWFNHCFFVIGVGATVRYDLFEAASFFLLSIAWSHLLSFRLLKNYLKLLGRFIANVRLGGDDIGWIWGCEYVMLKGSTCVWCARRSCLIIISGVGMVMIQGPFGLLWDILMVDDV